MRASFAVLACASVLNTFAAEAKELLLDNLMASIVIIPERRSDFSFEMHPGRRNAPEVKVIRTGNRVVLTSDTEVTSCSEVNGDMFVGLSDGRSLEMVDAPLVTVRAPQTFYLRGRHSAVVGQIGRTENLDIRQGGCAIWDIDDVEGTLRADMSGGARATIGTARDARLTASGGGAVATEGVENLVAEASGGGRIRVSSVSSQARAEASGGGRIEVEGGHGQTLRANASGGGWIAYDGEVASLSASASGGGQVAVAAAQEVVSRSESGGGRVIVAD